MKNVGDITIFFSCWYMVSFYTIHTSISIYKYIHMGHDMLCDGSKYPLVNELGSEDNAFLAKIQGIDRPQSPWTGSV